jgi:phosphopantothenoylcysteine synthetase/decarboxylase
LIALILTLNKERGIHYGGLNQKWKKAARAHLDKLKPQTGIIFIIPTKYASDCAWRGESIQMRGVEIVTAN